MILDCGGKPINLTTPVVMGILNVTPDSFSDGGNFSSIEQAIEHARQMVADGAAIIDVGGESTRPGAQPVSAAEEIDRVAPVIEVLVPQIDVPISIDTSKPEVIAAAAAAGAGLINDVYALRQPGALAAAAATGLPVCLMHMQGEPRTMQSDPCYDDLLHDIVEFFADRIEACESAGIAHDAIIVDPGIGFGKTLEHNLHLVANLDEIIAALDLPLLIGVSRKSMFGQLLNASVEARVPASLAAAVVAADRGARIIRAHDVRETVDALRVLTEVTARRH